MQLFYTPHCCACINTISLHSLVTAVPFPLVPRLHWEEVCCSLVLYSLWEAQQDSVIQISHARVIRRPEGQWRNELRLHLTSSLTRPGAQLCLPFIISYIILCGHNFSSRSIFLMIYCLKCGGYPVLLLWFLETLEGVACSLSSKVILLGKMCAQITGRNLGQLLCLCSASLSLQL